MEKSLWQQIGLTDEEYAQIQEILGREPNYVELGLLAAMWSEYCGYKYSRSVFPVLKYFPTEDPTSLKARVRMQGSGHRG